MSFVEKLKILFGITKIDTSPVELKPTGYEASGIGFLDSTVKVTEYLEEMKGWVGTSVFAIADEIGSIDISLFKVVKDGVEEVLEHPVLDLLFKVNSFTTKFDHFWLTQAYLELTGESPWFLDKVGNKIENIFFLRPDKFRPIIGKSKLIEGYEYEIGVGERVRLGVDEVLFLKYPNPAKPFRGIGTLQMAARTVDIDNSSEIWNNAFYENSARPDSIMTVKNVDNLSDEQRDILKKSLQDAYQGKDKAHKNMLLMGDITFEKSSFSQKDMDFTEQQKFGRDKILGIFRVPKAIVSQTDGVNFASAKTAQFIFARYTIKPKMERLVQQLNEFLLPMFSGTDNMFLDYKSPVPDDKESDVKRFESALDSGYMTINEVREEIGLEAIEGGDVIYLSNTISPVGEGGSRPQAGEGGEQRMLKAKRPVKKYNPDRIKELNVRGKRFFKVEKIKGEVKEKIKKALWKSYNNEKPKKVINKVVTKNGRFERVLTEQEISEFWTVKNAIFRKFLKKVELDMIEVFTKQKRSTLLKLSKAKGITTKQGSADELFNQIKLDEAKAVTQTLDVTFGTFQELFREAGNETFEMLQVDAEMNVDREEIKELIRDNGRVFATKTTQATNNFIRNEIISSVAAGESIPMLKSRIVGVFDKAESFRAERIARTETLRYNTSASVQAFKDSGIVEGKMWVTDPDPCQYCATLVGKTAPLNGNFVNKGDTILDRAFDYDDLPSPPLHPNCQCDVIPIFKPIAVDVRQVNKELDAIYAIAPSAKRQLDKISAGVVKSGKNRVLAKTRLKSRQRSLEKVVDEYRGDTKRITDIARNTVVVSSKRDYLSLSKSLSVTHKNRITSFKIADEVTDGYGYSGINVKMKMSNGLVGEMQVNTSWMIYAKEQKDIAVGIIGKDVYGKISRKVKVVGGKAHELYETGRLTKDIIIRERVKRESREYFRIIRNRIGDSI